MMTLGEMTTYISARLIDTNNTSVSLPSVVQAINDSITYWKKRRFWFNEVVDEAIIPQGVSQIPLPADFLVPSKQDGAFEIVYSNYRYIMVKTSAVNFDAWFLSNGNGLPRWYAKLANSEYHAYPIPDRDYTVRRYYLKNYVPLVNVDDTNDFMEYADSMIASWTLSKLHAELRQDMNMADYYRKDAMDEWNQLNVMTTKANASGRVSIESALSNQIVWN